VYCLAMSQLQIVNHANHPCKIWQKLAIVQQTFCQHFCRLLNDGKASAISCRPSVGNRRHAYSFPICTIHFAGKQGFATVATTLKQMAKSSATAWQSFSALGLPAKYWQNYPPEFVVILQVHDMPLVNQDCAVCRSWGQSACHLRHDQPAAPCRGSRSLQCMQDTACCCCCPPCKQCAHSVDTGMT